MITLLLNSEISQVFGKEILAVHYLFNTSGINFELDGQKLKLEEFILKITRKENRELLNLQIELKNLSPDKIRQICRSFGHDLYSEDFMKLNQIILRLTLNQRLAERYVRFKYPSLRHLADIFTIENIAGEKILLNFDNYSLEKVFDL
jgi:hypothetical protein